MSSQRMRAGSPEAEDTTRVVGESAIAEPARAPALQAVDDDEGEEGDAQHGDTDHRRAAIVELLERMTIRSGAISDTPGRLPAMKMTEPYSPTARAKASVTPVTNAGMTGGRTTVRMARKRLAPSRAAASSSSFSASISTGWALRTTKGSPMKTSATMMPSGYRRS